MMVKNNLYSFEELGTLITNFSRTIKSYLGISLIINVPGQNHFKEILFSHHLTRKRYSLIIFNVVKPPIFIRPLGCKKKGNKRIILLKQIVSMVLNTAKMSIFTEENN